ncbi:MAG: tetratricopeptide repeat protein [Arenicellales bacterium]
MKSINNRYTVLAAFVVITGLIFIFVKQEPQHGTNSSDNSADATTSKAVVAPDKPQPAQAVGKTETFSNAESKTRPIVAGPHKSHDPHSSLTAEKHIQVALQHKQEGRMFEAIQSLSMAIPKYSDNKDLYAVRASLYMEQGQPAAALQDLQQALKLAPDDAVLLTNRAQVYRQFGQIREALTDLNKAISLNPDLLPARFNRGAIYYSSGDYQLALEDFDQCVAIDPHVAGPYFNRASTKQELGDTVGAKNDLNRFIQLSDSEQWKSTAQDLLKRWEKDEASKAVEVPKT